MRLEQFVYFIEVVRERSISSASRKLGVPQQSLSSSIAALEEELGVVLLERSANGVRPNAMGLAVYDYMKQFLEQYQALRASFHPEQPKAVYHIPLAAQNNMMQTVIPQLTSELIKQQANIYLDVLEKPQDEILALVEREEIAMGIILCFVKGEEFYPSLPEGLIFRQLFASRPYFWMSQRHPLAKYKSTRYCKIPAQMKKCFISFLSSVLAPFRWMCRPPIFICSSSWYWKTWPCVLI